MRGLFDLLDVYLNIVGLVAENLLGEKKSVGLHRLAKAARSVVELCA